jgi:F-type H+-transporting ATPase subunit b
MKRVVFGAAGLAIGMAGQAHASGMPQLAFGNPLLLAQVVWGGIIFALFYIGVSRYGLPRVDAILDHRAGVISADLEQARTAKRQADQAVAELNEARRRAYAESQDAVNAATQKAKDDAARQAEAAKTRLDRQLAESEAQINAARAQAMASLHDVAASTADALIARLTHREPDQGRVRQVVGEAIRARGLAA